MFWICSAMMYNYPKIAISIRKTLRNHWIFGYPVVGPTWIEPKMGSPGNVRTKRNLTLENHVSTCLNSSFWVHWVDWEGPIKWVPGLVSSRIQITVFKLIVNKVTIIGWWNPQLSGSSSFVFRVMWTRDDKGFSKPLWKSLKYGSELWTF